VAEEEFRTLSSAVRGAAERQRFAATGEGIVWAVVGSGIHARHLHFEQHQNLALEPPLRHRDFTVAYTDDSTSEMEALVDTFGNTTHSAGVIAGELTVGGDTRLVVDLNEIDVDGAQTKAQATILAASGLAPRCKLLSVKVLDDQGSGRASTIIDALRWIRETNAAAGRLLIHGVTLAVGYEYEPQLFACGHSPLCVAANETVRAGVVVVAAAGNTGFGRHHTLARPSSGGVPMSIDDPGNAEYVITVGSTHSSDPHLYGVSYFSSKGPTADGRRKPDLVAPGERIISCGPDQAVEDEPHSRGVRYVENTGTTSATAYVSGVIAALLSVRRELIGQPLAIKKLLMATAEDLHRDPNLQGAGLVNMQRALEESSVKPTPVERAEQSAAAVTTPAPAAAPTPPASRVTDITSAAPGEKRFAVALSFPGERREAVAKVVWALRDLGLPRESIFYDRFHEAELVGPNLDSRLQKIYHDESELIVVFISAEYENKEWCGLEWRAIKDILKQRRDEDIIPARFDDTDVPGLFSIDGYVDLRKRDPELLADIINQRLKLNRSRRAPGIPPAKTR
jgi:subtilisin family serine protease